MLCLDLFLQLKILLILDCSHHLWRSWWYYLGWHIVLISLIIWLLWKVIIPLLHIILVKIIRLTIKLTMAHSCLLMLLLLRILLKLLIMGILLLILVLCLLLLLIIYAIIVNVLTYKTKLLINIINKRNLYVGWFLKLISIKII